ncbi:MAG: DUF2341 domain-containing protein, partial [Candidatus Thorarchaeota archaeon]
MNFPNDIRFGTSLDPNSATQLSQWYEASSATSAHIWVKWPSDNSDTIYIFAGNPNASFYSDGNSTFPIMFYKFDSDVTSDWTYTRAYGDSTHQTYHWTNSFNNGVSCSGARLRFRY